MNEWWELGSQLQGEEGETEPVWPVLNTTDTPGTPCSHVDGFTIISESFNLRGNQTKGKVGRV